MRIFNIKSITPKYDHDGYFAIRTKEEYYIEITFYELLSWICEHDIKLLAYLQTLDPRFTVCDEVETLCEIGYKFEDKIYKYLDAKEREFPGFIKDISIHRSELPPEMF